MKKLYVGNLSYEVTDESLQEIFANYGPVESAKVIIDRMSGESKGFGFVEIADDQSAEEAIQELDGQEVDGRAIKVNEAKPQEPRSGGGGGGYRGGDNRRGGGGYRGGDNRGGGGGNRGGGRGGSGGGNRGGGRGGGRGGNR